MCSVVILRRSSGTWYGWCISEQRSLGDVETIAAAYSLRRAHQEQRCEEIARCTRVRQLAIELFREADAAAQAARRANQADMEKAARAA